MMPFGVVGASLAEFGKQLISGTKEVLHTVSASSTSAGLLYDCACAAAAVLLDLSTLSEHI
jgi:hypothetical protein